MDIVNKKEIVLAKSAQYKVRGVIFEVTPHYYTSGEDMRPKLERLLKAEIAGQNQKMTPLPQVKEVL